MDYCKLIYNSSLLTSRKEDIKRHQGFLLRPSSEAKAGFCPSFYHLEEKTFMIT